MIGITASRATRDTLRCQAVKDLAAGFKVCARPGDKIIGAMESTVHRFALGIQWHPEALAEIHPQFILPFTALVKACRT